MNNTLSDENDSDSVEDTHNDVEEILDGNEYQ